MTTNSEFGEPGPGPGDIAPARGAGGLAERLLAAQRVLESTALDDPVRARFQRRLTAICDALKAPGADPARCARRLDLFLADLGRQAEAGADGGREPGK